MRIMSFNIRMDTAGDKDHAWPHRIPSAREMLATFAPDVLGIQEGLPHQVQEIDSWLDAYTRISRGRRADGSDESVAVYFRNDRFECLQSGHFWLSDTPDVPGSATWGNSIPRMVTWVRLRQNDGREWFIVNTHLDHASEPARQKGARLIADFLARHREDSASVVVTGDFNAVPGSVAVQTMLEAGLVDAVAAAGDQGPTYHGYKGEGGDRIDYVFSDPRLTVRGGGVFREKCFGLYPSDHYPVYADLE